MRYIKTGILLILFSIYGTLLIAQTVKENRRLIRTYKLTPAMLVEVNNKYGSIEIEYWDVDSVRFVINFEMKAKSQEKLKKLEKLINFNFAGSDEYIRATTNVGTGGGDIKSEFDNLTNAIGTIGSEVVIDYVVYVPVSNRLKLKNSFGNIFMGNVKTNLDIELSHGDLRIGEVINYSSINLKFGKAIIQSLSESKIDCQFANLNIEKCNRLTLVSKSSTIDINSINDLNINSKRDVISINQANVVNGSIYFTKLTIYQFIRNMNIETKFGALNLEMINKTFDNIQINSSYTDIMFIFQTGSNFQFVLTHNELSFTYPTDKAILNTLLVNKEMKQYKTSGEFGNTVISGPKVNILASKGSLKILFRDKK